ncbi:Fumarate reductase-like FeS protein [Desulfitobacterium hafniense]|uniref:succinate dehydrogenase n=1 Tax=Desulfitobacterium hafniense TaxID=49338 RepID=A0A098B6H2_DESHA|nr:2Fe-2S iron-sulfur cluster-binding protein [Desulfitobacterium hafniense]CDX03970.1 Fumarate reductase-like FeS protein [Desulfitobacterium hafniense]
MKIKIFKYDPAVDVAPRFIEHEVPHKDKMTMLEAVVWVHENKEMVAYDYSCHGRMCGRCAMMLDGVPTLACCTPIDDKAHTIEPLKGMTVIRDLIVDKSSLSNRVSVKYQRVRTEPIKEDEIDKFDKAAADTLYDMVNCTRCGCCDAGCPVVQSAPGEYAGPAVMLAIAHRHLDSYDQADRVVEAVGEGLYKCIMCGNCDKVCRRYEIKHVEAWQMLREAAEKRGLKPSYAK